MGNFCRVCLASGNSNYVAGVGHILIIDVFYKGLVNCGYDVKAISGWCQLKSSVTQVNCQVEVSRRSQSVVCMNKTYFS